MSAVQIVKKIVPNAGGKASEEVVENLTWGTITQRKDYARRVIATQCPARNGWKVGRDSATKVEGDYAETYFIRQIG